MDGAFEWVPYIVHATHKPLFSHKLLLKMDLMSLFTHLKIILLQCFRFLILSKISGIQNNYCCFSWINVQSSLKRKKFGLDLKFMWCLCISTHYYFQPHHQQLHISHQNLHIQQSHSTHHLIPRNPKNY